MHKSSKVKLLGFSLFYNFYSTRKPFFFLIKYWNFYWYRCDEGGLAGSAYSRYNHIKDLRYYPKDTRPSEDDIFGLS